MNNAVKFGVFDLFREEEKSSIMAFGFYRYGQFLWEAKKLTNAKMCTFKIRPGGWCKILGVLNASFPSIFRNIGGAIAPQVPTALRCTTRSDYLRRVAIKLSISDTETVHQNLFLYWLAFLLC